MTGSSGRLHSYLDTVCQNLAVQRHDKELARFLVPEHLETFDVFRDIIGRACKCAFRHFGIFLACPGIFGL